MLKPGVVYEPGQHSFVAEQPAPRRMATSDTATTLPSYRYRLLGVFDDTTGAPIAGARVLDVNTGTFVTTDTTGTISLVFLPDGGSLVRIIRQGYADLDIVVEIGPTLQTPLTLLMQRRSQH